MKAEDIFKKYSAELKSVERELLAIFDSAAAIVPLVGQHIVNSGGKRIRPLFLLMSADMCGFHGKERAKLGAIIEAIHTASLLHDDVIDGAETRRGKAAANTMWGNQIVVLVGDFLYSNALRLAVERKSQKIMEALSEATTRMTEGELLQLYKTGDPEITVEEYYKIISAKTGILISAACRIGAVLSDQPDIREKALSEFGLKVGIAFQLADDILDYVAKQKDLGKKLGKDLDEGKITMPLIHLLKSATAQEREEVIDIIKETAGAGDNGKGDVTPERRKMNLDRITALFTKYNAIEESFNVARKLVKEAEALLDIFPESESKTAILTMADYTLQRKK
ncbi:MAG TPA: polyprenyl synthetase family protein [Dissulfurispiraceae bacterium]|nr:polyprenyl synthetase family protein [Dissulfurispiraceae bacterium]